MGKAMISFGKNAREKARQLKQIEKTAKRLQAKKADMEKILNKESRITEPKPELITTEPVSKGASVSLSYG